MDGNWTVNCLHNSYSFTQFVLIVYIGSSIATLGVLCNLLLLFLLLYPSVRQRNQDGALHLYFVTLVCLDVAICAMYLLLFSVDTLAEYAQIRPLFVAWTSYVLPVLTASKVVQLVSTYVIVVASWERYCLVSEQESKRAKEMSSHMINIPNSKDQSILPKVVSCCGVGDRDQTKAGYFQLLVVLIIALTLRLPCYWEFTLKQRPACAKLNFFATVEFVPFLMENEFYRIFFTFYFMNIVQVFAPFFMLIILNSVTVYKLHRNLALARRLSAMFLDSRVRGLVRRRLKEAGQIKAATYRIVAVVSMYLLCNSVHFFLSFMENVARIPLLEDKKGVPTDAYNYLTDVVSLLFMINSFLRLFIHLSINADLRRDFKELMCTLVGINLAHKQTIGAASRISSRARSTSL